MHVEMNGKVSVYPTGRPPYVEVYHRLRKIEPQLVLFKREFDKAQTLDFQQVYASHQKALHIRKEYILALGACSSCIEGWHYSRDKFYDILRLFLERTASNDHTVLPFFSYMFDYRCRVELAAESGIVPLLPMGSLGDYKHFISERANEAIQVCRSYLCMLSESMDSSLKEVRLGQLLSQVFEVQKKVFIFKSYNDHYPLGLSQDESYARRQDIIQNELPREYLGVTFKDNYGSSVIGFEPLLHILPMFLITNALKATTIAHDRQTRGINLGDCLANASGEPAYKKISPISSPKVEVVINDEGSNKISISVSDNGIGMPKKMLYNLLSSNSQSTLFGKYVESGGVCMNLIGHILDFVDGELHAESEIGQGTTFKIILPKKLELN